MSLKENLISIEPNKLNTIFSYREKPNIKLEKKYNFFDINNVFDPFKTNNKTSISSSPSETRFNHFKTTGDFSKKNKYSLTQNKINSIKPKVSLNYIGNKTSYLNNNNKKYTKYTKFNNKTEFIPYPTIYKTLKPKKDLQAKQKIKITEKSLSVNKKNSVFNYIKFEKQKNNEESDTLFVKIFEDKDLKFNKNDNSDTEIKRKKSLKKINTTISKNKNKDLNFIVQEYNNFNKITKEELSKTAENIYNFNNKYKIKNKEDLKEISINKLNIHNIFFNFILDNVYRGIEIINEHNKNISYELVKNLLINEIKNFQVTMKKMQNKYIKKKFMKRDSVFRISKEDKILENVLKKLNFEIFGNFNLETLNKDKNGNSVSLNLPSFTNNLKLPMKFDIKENEDILEINDKLLDNIQNNEINENYFALLNKNNDNQNLEFNKRGILVQNELSNTINDFNNIEDNKIDNNNNNENKNMSIQKLKYVQYIKYVQYLNLFEDVCNNNQINSKDNVNLVFKNLKIIHNNLKALKINQREVQVYNKILNINSSVNFNTMYENALKNLNYFSGSYGFRGEKIIDQKIRNIKLEPQPKTNKEKTGKIKKVFKTASDLIKQISTDIETNFELFKLKKRGYNEARLRRSLLSLPENGKNENKNANKNKNFANSADKKLNEIPEIINEDESNLKEIEKRNNMTFSFKNGIVKNNVNQNILKEMSIKKADNNNAINKSAQKKKIKKKENKNNAKDQNSKFEGISGSTNTMDIIKSYIENGMINNADDKKKTEKDDDNDELNEEEEKEYRKILAMKLKQSAFYRKFIEEEFGNNEILEKNESIESESYTLEDNENDEKKTNSKINNIIKNTMLKTHKKNENKRKKKTNKNINTNISINNKIDKNQINYRNNSIKINKNKSLDNNTNKIKISNSNDNSKKNLNKGVVENDNKINTDVNLINNDNEKKNSTNIDTNNPINNKPIKDQNTTKKIITEEYNNQLSNDENQNYINKDLNYLHNNPRHINENEISGFVNSSSILRKNKKIRQKPSSKNSNASSTFSLSDNDDEKNEDSIRIINGVNAMDGLPDKDKENLIKHLIILKNIKNIKEKSLDHLAKEQKEKKAIRKLVNKYIMDLLTQNLTINWGKKKGGGLTKKERLEMYKKLGILYEYELFEMNEEEQRKIFEKLETEDFGDFSYLNDKIKASINNFLIQQESLQQALTQKHVRKKIFGKIKDDKIKKLIFDNSYLFNKNKEKKYSDDEMKDILKNSLNAKNGQNNKDDLEYTNSGYYDFNESSNVDYVKKKFVKKKRGHNLDFKKWNKEVGEKNDQNDNVDNEELLKKKKEEQERLKQELRDKRLYEFFRKIQKLKNDTSNSFVKELDFLIEEQTEHMNFNKEKNDTRIINFIQDLELNRSKTEFNKKYLAKKLCFASPISFTTSNFYTSRSKDIT